MIKRFLSSAKKKFFAEQPSGRSMSQTIADRQTAWDYAGFWGLLPDPDPVLQQLSDGGVQVLENLLADAHLLSVVQTRKLGTLKKEFKWEPGSIDGKTTPASEQLCRDLHRNFNNIRTYDLISGLLDAPLLGLSPVEIIWQPGNNGAQIKELRVLPARWFGFDVDNQPRYISQASAWDGEEIPWGKMFFCRHFPTYDNPYGLRLLSRCLWPAAFKKGGMKFFVTFTEKYGMPFMLGKYQRGSSTEEQQAMLNSLVKMVRDAVSVVPEGNSVEMLGGGGSNKSASSSDTYTRLINVCNAEMSKVIVGQDATAEVGENSSFGAMDGYVSILDDYQQGDATLVKGSMDEIGKIYAAVNAPGVPAPVFAWFEKDDPKKDFAERDKIINEGGSVLLTRSYYIRQYGYQDDDLLEVEPTGITAKTDFAEGVSESEPVDDPETELVADTVDALTAQLLSNNSMTAWIEQAKALLDNSADLESYRDNLLDLFAAMTPDDLATAMARAMSLADLSGRADEH